MIDKKDNFITNDPNQPGKRAGAYALAKHEIDIVVVVNEKDFSEEDHNKLGEMACRGVMAAIGLMEHGEKAEELKSRIRFKLVGPTGQPVRTAKKWVDLVYEAIHWGIHLCYGCREYDQKFLPEGETAGDGQDFGVEDVMSEYAKCSFFDSDPRKKH